MGYTKREWKVSVEGIVSLNYNIKCDGKFIARVIGQNSSANAHLIASAPDLYEACKMAQGGKGDWRGVIDLALAKAEGKQ